MSRKLTLLFDYMIVLRLMQIPTTVVVGEPQVPCYFIFGDSLVDSGNNNGLVTEAKANYTPYGIDFPEGVTGRFTNGRTFADIIGQLLGFDSFIPPFATAAGKEFNKGVNYASGSSGIREETGSQVGDRISLGRQLLDHNFTISRLRSLQQNTTFLQKCIYLVNTGGNDYINNYYVPEFYNTSQIYTTDEYANVLIQQYSQQLRSLYSFGGRKISVFGVSEVGCLPIVISKFGTDGKSCVEAINNAVKLFNNRLKSLIHELNNNSDARFTFINFTSISTLKREETLSSDPCCQVNEIGVCIPNTLPCPDRALSIFYDGFHPTEMAATIIATRSYTALSPMDASPYDISHLARLRDAHYYANI